MAPKSSALEDLISFDDVFEDSLSQTVEVSSILEPQAYIALGKALDFPTMIRATKAREVVARTALENTTLVVPEGNLGAYMVKRPEIGAATLMNAETGHTEQGSSTRPRNPPQGGKGSAAKLRSLPPGSTPRPEKNGTSEKPIGITEPNPETMGTDELVPTQQIDEGPTIRFVRVRKTPVTNIEVEMISKFWEDRIKGVAEQVKVNSIPSIVKAPKMFTRKDMDTLRTQFSTKKAQLNKIASARAKAQGKPTPPEFPDLMITAQDYAGSLLYDPSEEMMKMASVVGGLIGHACVISPTDVAPKDENQSCRHTSAVASLLFSGGKQIINALTHHSRFDEMESRVCEFDAMGYQVQPPTLDQRVRAAILRELLLHVVNNKSTIPAKVTRGLLPIEISDDPLNVLEPTYKGLVGQMRLIGIDPLVTQLELDRADTKAQEILLHNLQAAGPAAPPLPKSKGGIEFEKRRYNPAPETWSVKYETEWECNCTNAEQSPATMYEIYRHTLLLKPDSGIETLFMENDFVYDKLFGHHAQCIRCGMHTLQCRQITRILNDMVVIFCRRGDAAKMDISPGSRPLRSAPEAKLGKRKRHVVTGVISESDYLTFVSVPHYNHTEHTRNTVLEIDERGGTEAKQIRHWERELLNDATIVLAMDGMALSLSENNHLVVGRSDVSPEAELTDLPSATGLTVGRTALPNLEMREWWNKSFPNGRDCADELWTKVNLGERLSHTSDIPKSENLPPICLALLATLRVAAIERQECGPKHSRVPHPAYWMLGEEVLTPKSAIYDHPINLLQDFRQNGNKRHIKARTLEVFARLCDEDPFWKEYEFFVTEKIKRMNVSQVIQVSSAQLGFYTNHPVYFSPSLVRSANLTPQVKWDTEMVDGRPSNYDPRPAERVTTMKADWHAFFIPEHVVKQSEERNGKFQQSEFPRNISSYLVTVPVSPEEAAQHRAHTEDPVDRLNITEPPHSSIHFYNIVRIPKVSGERQQKMTCDEARRFLFKFCQWDRIRTAAVCIILDDKSIEASILDGLWAKLEMGFGVDCNLEEYNQVRKEVDDHMAYPLGGGGKLPINERELDNGLKKKKREMAGFTEVQTFHPEDMSRTILWAAAVPIARKVLELDDQRRISAAFQKVRDPVALTTIGYPRLMEMTFPRIHTTHLSALRADIILRVAPKQELWLPTNFDKKALQESELFSKLVESFRVFLCGPTGSNENYRIETYLNWLISEAETIDVMFGKEGPKLEQKEDKRSLLKLHDPTTIENFVMSSTITNASMEVFEIVKRLGGRGVRPYTAEMDSDGHETRAHQLTMWAYARMLRDLLEISARLDTRDMFLSGLTPQPTGNKPAIGAATLRDREDLNEMLHQWYVRDPSSAQSRLLRRALKTLNREELEVAELERALLTSRVVYALDPTASTDTLESSVKSKRSDEIITAGKWRDLTLDGAGITIQNLWSLLPQSSVTVSYHTNYIFGGNHPSQRDLSNEEVPELEKLLAVDVFADDFLEQMRAIVSERLLRDGHNLPFLPRARAIRLAVIKAYKEHKGDMSKVRQKYVTRMCRSLDRCIARFVVEEARCQTRELEYKIQDFRGIPYAIPDDAMPTKDALRLAFDTRIVSPSEKANAHVETGTTDISPRADGEANVAPEVAAEDIVPPIEPNDNTLGGNEETETFRFIGPALLTEDAAEVEIDGEPLGFNDNSIVMEVPLNEAAEEMISEGEKDIQNHRDETRKLDKRSRGYERKIDLPEKRDDDDENDDSDNDLDGDGMKPEDPSDGSRVSASKQVNNSGESESRNENSNDASGAREQDTMSEITFSSTPAGKTAKKDLSNNEVTFCRIRDEELNSLSRETTFKVFRDLGRSYIDAFTRVLYRSALGDHKDKDSKDVSGLLSGVNELFGMVSRHLTKLSPEEEDLVAKRDEWPTMLRSARRLTNSILIANSRVFVHMERLMHLWSWYAGIDKIERDDPAEENLIGRSCKSLIKNITLAVDLAKAPGSNPHWIPELWRYGRIDKPTGSNLTLQVAPIVDSLVGYADILSERELISRYAKEGGSEPSGSQNLGAGQTPGPAPRKVRAPPPPPPPAPIKKEKKAPAKSICGKISSNKADSIDEQKANCLQKAIFYRHAWRQTLANLESTTLTMEEAIILASRMREGLAQTVASDNPNLTEEIKYADKHHFLVNYEATMRGLEQISSQHSLLIGLRALFSSLVNELSYVGIIDHRMQFDCELVPERVRVRRMLEEEVSVEQSQPWNPDLLTATNPTDRLFKYSINRVKHDIRRQRDKAMSILRVNGIARGFILETNALNRDNIVHMVTNNSTRMLDAVSKTLTLAKSLIGKEYSCPRDTTELKKAVEEISEIKKEVGHLATLAGEEWKKSIPKITKEWEKDTCDLIEKTAKRLISLIDKINQVESVDFILWEQFGPKEVMIWNPELATFLIEGDAPRSTDISLLPQPQRAAGQDIDPKVMKHKRYGGIVEWHLDSTEGVIDISRPWRNMKFDTHYRRVSGKGEKPAFCYLPDFTPTYDDFFKPGALLARYRIDKLDQGQLFPFDEVPLSPAFYAAQQKGWQRIRSYFLNESRLNAMAAKRMRQVCIEVARQARDEINQNIRAPRDPSKINPLLRKVTNYYNSKEELGFSYNEQLQARGNCKGVQPPRQTPSLTLLDDACRLSPAYRNRHGKLDLTCIAVSRRPMWDELDPQLIAFLMAKVMTKDLGYMGPPSFTLHSTRDWDLTKVTLGEAPQYYEEPGGALVFNSEIAMRRIEEETNERNIQHGEISNIWAEYGPIDSRASAESSWDLLEKRGEAEWHLARLRKCHRDDADRYTTGAFLEDIFPGLNPYDADAVSEKCPSPYPLERTAMTIPRIAEEVIQNLHTVVSHMRITQLLPPDLSHLAESVEALRPGSGGPDYSLWALERLCFGATFIHLTAHKQCRTGVSISENDDAALRETSITSAMVRDNPANPKLLNILGWLKREDEEDPISWGRVDWVRVMEEDLRSDRIKPLLIDGIEIQDSLDDHVEFKLEDRPYLLNPLNYLDSEKLLTMIRTDAARLARTPAAITLDNLRKEVTEDGEYTKSYDRTHLDVLNGNITIDEGIEKLRKEKIVDRSPLIPIVEPASATGDGDTVVAIVRESLPAEPPIARREATWLRTNAFADHALPDNFQWWEDMASSCLFHEDYFPIEWRIALKVESTKKIEDEAIKNKWNVIRVMWYMTRKRFLALASISALDASRHDADNRARGRTARAAGLITKIAEYFTGETRVPPIAVTTATDPTFGLPRMPVEIPVKNSSLFVLGSHAFQKNEYLKPMNATTVMRTYEHVMGGGDLIAETTTGQQYKTSKTVPYPEDEVKHIQSTPLTCPPYHAHLAKIFVVTHFIDMMRRRPILQSLLRAPYLEAGSAQTRRETGDIIKKILDLGTRAKLRAHEGINLLRELAGERGAQKLKLWEAAGFASDSRSHPVLGDHSYLPASTRGAEPTNHEDIAQMVAIFRNVDLRTADMTGDHKHMPAESFYEEGLKTTLDLIGLVTASGPARWAREIPEIQHRVRVTAGRGLLDIDQVEDGDRVKSRHISPGIDSATVPQESIFEEHLRILQEWAKLVPTDCILYQAFQAGIKTERNSEAPDADKAGTAAWEQVKECDDNSPELHTMEADQVAIAITHILLADMVTQQAARPLLWFYKMSQIAKAMWFEDKTAMLTCGVPTMADKFPIMAETPTLVKETGIQAFWLTAKLSAPYLITSYYGSSYFQRGEGLHRTQRAIQTLPLIGRNPDLDSKVKFAEEMVCLEFRPTSRGPVMRDTTIPKCKTEQPWDEEWCRHEIQKGDGKTFVASDVASSGDLKAAARRMKILLTLQYYEAAETFKSLASTKQGKLTERLLHMWYIEDMVWPESLLRTAYSEILPSTLGGGLINGRAKVLPQEDHELAHSELIHNHDPDEAHEKMLRSIKMQLNSNANMSDRRQAEQTAEEHLKEQIASDMTLRKGPYISGRDYPYAIAHRSPAIYDGRTAGLNYSREIATLFKNPRLADIVFLTGGESESTEVADEDTKDNVGIFGKWGMDAIRRLAKVKHATTTLAGKYGREPRPTEVDDPVTIFTGEDDEESTTIRKSAEQSGHRHPGIQTLRQYDLGVDPLAPDCVWLDKKYVEHGILVEGRQHEAANFMHNRGSLHLLLDCALQFTLSKEARTGIPKVILQDKDTQGQVVTITAEDNAPNDEPYDSYVEAYDPMEATDPFGDSTAVRIREVAECSTATNIREIVSTSLTCPTDGVSKLNRRQSGGGHPILDSVLSMLREARLCLVTGQDPYFLYRACTRYDNYRLDIPLRLSEDSRKLYARWSNPVGGEINPASLSLLQTPDNLPVIPEICSLLVRPLIQPYNTEDEILLVPNRHIIGSGRNLLLEGRQGNDIQRIEVNKMDQELIKYSYELSSKNPFGGNVSKLEDSDQCNSRRVCVPSYNPTPRAVSLPKTKVLWEQAVKRVKWYGHALHGGMPTDIEPDATLDDNLDHSRSWIPRSEERNEEAVNEQPQTPPTFSSDSVRPEIAQIQASFVIQHFPWMKDTKSVPNIIIGHGGRYSPGLSQKPSMILKIYTEFNKNTRYCISTEIGFRMARRDQWDSAVREGILKPYPFTAQRHESKQSSKTPEGPCFIPINQPRNVQIRGQMVAKARAVANLDLREVRHHSYEYVQITPRANCIQEERDWQTDHENLFWYANAGACEPLWKGNSFYCEVQRERCNMLMTHPRQNFQLEAMTNIQTQAGILDLTKGFVVPYIKIGLALESRRKLELLAEEDAKQSAFRLSPEISRIEVWTQRYKGELARRGQVIQLGQEDQRGSTTAEDEGRHQNLIDFRVKGRENTAESCYVEAYDRQFRERHLNLRKRFERCYENARNQASADIFDGVIDITKMSPRAWNCWTVIEEGINNAWSSEQEFFICNSFAGTLSSKSSTHTQLKIFAGRDHETAPLHFTERYVQNNRSLIRTGLHLKKRLGIEGDAMEIYPGMYFCPYSQQPVVGAWPSIRQMDTEDRYNPFGFEKNDSTRLFQCEVDWREAAGNYGPKPLASFYQRVTEEGGKTFYTYHVNSKAQSGGTRYPMFVLKGDIESFPEVACNSRARAFDSIFPELSVFKYRKTCWLDEGQPKEEWWKNFVANPFVPGDRSGLIAAAIHGTHNPSRPW